MEIWHHPRCSNSRGALELLQEAGEQPRVRRYLDEPPSAEELVWVLDLLGVEPWDIARMGEQVAKDMALSARPRDRSDWINVLIANPILIQRPIVISDDGRAVVARPPKKLRELLD